VTVPSTAPAAAVKLTVWKAPQAVNGIEAGAAVTPAGALKVMTNCSPVSMLQPLSPSPEFATTRTSADPVEDGSPATRVTVAAPSIVSTRLSACAIPLMVRAAAAARAVPSAARRTVVKCLLMYFPP
jgi:hypothetical protein